MSEESKALILLNWLKDNQKVLDVNVWTDAEVLQFATHYHQHRLEKDMPSDEEIDEMNLENSKNMVSGSYLNGFQVGFSRGMLQLRQILKPSIQEVKKNS